MGEASKSEISATKLLVFIGMLFTVSLGITYFYQASTATFPFLFILWGIICLVIAFLLFVILEIISFGAFKIPSQWWILLIFGIALFVIAFFFRVSNYFPGIYFPAILIIMAAIIQLLTEKKTYMISKMVAIVGAGFGAWDCIALVLPPTSVIFIINAIIGLALIVILFLLIFDIDFWIFKYSWWIILLIGFVIFIWISPAATFLQFGGYGGIIILIAFVLVVMSL